VMSEQIFLVATVPSRTHLTGRTNLSPARFVFEKMKVVLGQCLP
jgi:hypothetical protein